VLCMQVCWKLDFYRAFVFFISWHSINYMTNGQNRLTQLFSMTEGTTFKWSVVGTWYCCGLRFVSLWYWVLVIGYWCEVWGLQVYDTYDWEEKLVILELQLQNIWLRQVTKWFYI
jgi:hypothetical protein